jgi:hypothetical protein
MSITILGHPTSDDLELPAPALQEETAGKMSCSKFGVKLLTVDSCAGGVKVVVVGVNGV